MKKNDSIESTTLKSYFHVSCQKPLLIEIHLAIYKSTNSPCIEDCCHMWPGALLIYLMILESHPTKVLVFLGPHLSSQFPSLSHFSDVPPPTPGVFFYDYFGVHCSNKFLSIAPRPHKFRRSTMLADTYLRLTFEIARCNHKTYCKACFFFFFALLGCGTLIRFFAFPSPTILKNLNITPIAIFCLLKSCFLLSFLLTKLFSSSFTTSNQRQSQLSWGRNDCKKYYKKKKLIWNVWTMYVGWNMWISTAKFSLDQHKNVTS